MRPLCGYCGQPLGGRVGDCPSVCGRSHHEECWTENGGCSTFGCPANPQPGYGSLPRTGFVFVPLVNTRQVGPADHVSGGTGRTSPHAIGWPAILGSMAAAVLLLALLARAWRSQPVPMPTADTESPSTPSSTQVPTAAVSSLTSRVNTPTSPRPTATRIRASQIAGPTPGPPSLDGRIAYSVYLGNQYYEVRIATTAGEIQRSIANVSEPSLSPDGTRIAARC